MSKEASYYCPFGSSIAPCSAGCALALIDDCSSSENLEWMCAIARIGENATEDDRYYAQSISYEGSDDQ